MSYVLLATVLTLLIKFITFALMLVVSCTAPKPGSMEVVNPMRARKRSSERMAMALRRRTETVMWPVSG